MQRALAQTEGSASQRFYFSKWVTFSCATLLMLSAGLQYAFTIYGEPLSADLNLSNSEFSTLGAFSNAGGYSALLAGLFFDFIKRYRRIGPFVCASVGALFYAVGFYGLYAAATHAIPAPMWLLAILVYLATNGGTWLEAAALTTCVSNFETERGAVIGIMKAFLGLSASIYTTLYMTLCKRQLDFLRLLALVPPLVALTASLGVNLVPYRQVEPHSKSHAFHISINATLSLAVYQLVAAMYFRVHSGPDDSDAAWTMCCAAACLLVPIMTLPAVFGGIRATPLTPGSSTMQAAERSPNAAAPGAREQRNGNERVSIEEPLLSGTVSEAAAVTESDVERSAHARPVAERGSDAQRRWGVLRAAVRYSHNTKDVGQGYLVTDVVEATLLQCFKMLDFWLLTFAASACTGISLAFINNAGPLVRSIGGDSTVTGVVVSVFSVANCLGRMCTAFLPEELPKGRVLPRTHFLVLGCAATAATALLDAVSTVDMMPYTSLATGFVFGFVQALGPAIISELFGLAHFATNAAFVSTTFIASSFGIAAMLPSWSYARGATHGSRECHGHACFGLAFVICAILGVVTVLCSIVLTVRRRKYYKRMFRVMRRERNMRGSTAKRREQERALQAMDARVDKARVVVTTSHAHMHALKRRLKPGMKPAQLETVARDLESDVERIEAGLAQVQAVLGGEQDESPAASFVMSESGSPELRSV